MTLMGLSISTGVGADIMMAFFDISYLYPEGSGIGGGDGGYNMYQSIITAKPLRNGEVPVDPAQLGFYDNGDTDVGITINRLEGEISSSLDFYVKNLFNISDSYFRGEFGIGVFDSSGKLVLTSDSPHYPIGGMGL